MGKFYDSCKSKNGEVTAENVLNQLEKYGMLSSESIMEHAVKLYNDNADVVDIKQGKAIVESLKLFIEVYRLDREEHGGKGSMLRTKILMFIALCNYKIGNINRAYCIAKQGLEAIDEEIAHSVFVGLDPAILGADTVNELIEVIEESHIDEVNVNGSIYDVQPEELDLRQFDEMVDVLNEVGKPSKQLIKKAIDTISQVQSQFSKIAEQMGDPIRGYETNQMFETFKLPLYFAWRGYKYGWHTDFCEEGDSLFPFMMFEMELRKNTQELIDLLKSQSPFAKIERDSAITKMLLSIFECFVQDIDNGTVKII